MRVAIERTPEAPREARAVVLLVARELGIAFGDAAKLIARLPVVLPRAFEPAEATALVARLRQTGASASEEPAPDAAAARCVAHRSFIASEPCAGCGRLVCTLCRALAGGAWRCEDCARKSRRRRGFYRIRVSVLLLVLAGVLVFAWNDVRQRRRRNDWQRPLLVALVLVRHGEVDAGAIDALRSRVPALQDRLHAEWLRYRGAGDAPVWFVVDGPVDVSSAPPRPAGDGLVDLARYAWDKRGYLQRIDAATRLRSAGIDSTIYLVMRPARGAAPRFVEGASEQGGRVGLVEVDMDRSMADFALFVAAHELFHTLEATDKYDDNGDVLLPSGLAEPELVPPFPQRYTELMARHRAVAPGRSAPPESLAELRVGPLTAKEIGWLRVEE